MLRDESVLLQVVAHVIDKRNAVSKIVIPATQKIAPFWGSLSGNDDLNTCFVLMPFEQRLTEIYERYIKPPINKRTTLKCIRADDIFAPRPIMNDIWTEIARAKVIVADLTTRNPNVLYELGMAHTLGKRTIIISQTIEDVPFDLRGVRIILYANTLSGYEKLSEEIIKYVQEFGID